MLLLLTLLSSVCLSNCAYAACNASRKQKLQLSTGCCTLTLLLLLLYSVIALSFYCQPTHGHGNDRRIDRQPLMLPRHAPPCACHTPQKYAKHFTASSVNCAHKRNARAQNGSTSFSQPHTIRGKEREGATFISTHTNALAKALHTFWPAKYHTHTHSCQEAPKFDRNLMFLGEQ